MAVTPEITRAPGRGAEPRRLEYRVRGMDCAEEVTALKRELDPLVGGEENLALTC